MVYRCIGGAPADEGGVCSEHGETACVIGVATSSATDGSNPESARPEVSAAEPAAEGAAAQPKGG